MAHNVAGLCSESAEQQALITWWTLEGSRLAPGALLFAIPNGGKRNPVTAARLRREGVLAGVPDLLLAWPAGGYYGLFVEMKRARPFRASVSPEQKAVMAALQAAGYRCTVARGHMEAREAIAAYLAQD